MPDNGSAISSMTSVGWAGIRTSQEVTSRKEVFH
jgi:hypothetical protein